MEKLERNGVIICAHEELTVKYFLEKGENIVLNMPVCVPNNKNADFLMRGVLWEVKSPVSDNVCSMETTLKRAVKQSQNVIIDLRRIKGEDVCLFRILQRKGREIRRLRWLLIIRKSGELFELKKK